MRVLGFRVLKSLFTFYGPSQLAQRWLRIAIKFVEVPYKWLRWDVGYLFHKTPISMANHYHLVVSVQVLLPGGMFEEVSEVPVSQTVVGSDVVRMPLLVELGLTLLPRLLTKHLSWFIVTLTKTMYHNSIWHDSKLFCIELKLFLSANCNGFALLALCFLNPIRTFALDPASSPVLFLVSTARMFSLPQCWWKRKKDFRAWPKLLSPLLGNNTFFLKGRGRKSSFLHSSLQLSGPKSWKIRKIFPKGGKRGGKWKSGVWSIIVPHTTREGEGVLEGQMSYQAFKGREGHKKDLSLLL